MTLEKQKQQTSKPGQTYELKKIKLNMCFESSSLTSPAKTGLAVFLRFGSFLRAGSDDGRLPVDICGPVPQVEDEEEDGKDDTRDLVHFADAVVRLTHSLRHVLAIHFGQPDLSDRLGWGGRGGGALGDGGQSWVFGHAHAVGGSHDVESVVGLFGEGRRLSSLWKK